MKNTTLDDAVTQDSIDLLDTADLVVDALLEQGYTAKVCDRSGVRVYVTHGAGRKAREMGHIEISATGPRAVALNMKPCKNGAGLGDIIIAALRERGITATR